MISYQTCGDHLLKPFGLRLVIQVHAAHQVVSCHRNREKREDHRLRTFTLSLLIQLHNNLRICPLGGATTQRFSHNWCVRHTCTLLVPLPSADTIIPTVQTVWTDHRFHNDIMSNDKRKKPICHFINVTAWILLTIKQTLILCEIKSERKWCWSVWSSADDSPSSTVNVCWWWYTCLLICTH